MDAEILIIVGSMLVFSGAVWLISEAGKVHKKDLEKLSLTERYRQLKKAYQGKKWSYLWGFSAILASFYTAYKSMIYNNYIYTGLFVLTSLWYLKVSKSIASFGFMTLISVLLGYLNINLGLVWLLTVIGSGYYEASSPRDKHNIFVQLAVVLNPVSAIYSLVNNQKIVPMPEESEKLAATDAGSEPLLDCPLCQTQMKMMVLNDQEEKIVFDLCPNCKAAFFDDRDHLWPVSMSIEEHKKSKKTKIDCPRCQIRMNASHLKLDPKSSTVYSCYTCHGNLLI